MAAVLATLALVALAGCGGGGGSAASSTSAQPQGTTGAFGIPGLSGLERYPRSRAAGPVAHGPGGVLARTFTVTGAEPRQIFQFFVSTLPREGWTAVPGDTSGPVLRGLWQRRSKTLVVAISAAPTVSAGSNEAVSQYSFVLYPPGQQSS